MQTSLNGVLLNNFPFVNILQLQSKDQKYLNGLILEEKHVETEKKSEILFAEKQAKNKKTIKQEALLDELVSISSSEKIT